MSKFNLKPISKYDSEIKIKLNDNYEAVFSTMTGFLQKFVTKSTEIKSKIKLIQYGTTTAKEKSGAYLFLPDGPAIDLDPSRLQWIRVEHENPLRDRICANYTFVLHCVEFYHVKSPHVNFKLPIFNVWNVVDLRQTINIELAMHIETDIVNKNVLYTDLNGFQYVKRKTYLSKLPIQGNVYPMPTGSFIQDDRMRFNILTSGPVGVASLQNAAIQVFLDRRLDQDDNRGMEQPMNDNVVASSRFILIFESMVVKNSQNDENDLERLSFPSIVAQFFSTNLLNPMIKLKVVKDQVSIHPETSFVDTKIRQPPCDLQLVNMRTMQNEREEPLPNEVSVILRRLAYDDCSSSFSRVDVASFAQYQCRSGADFSFQDFFSSFLDDSIVGKMKVSNLLLVLAENDEQERRGRVLRKENVIKYVQPIQIEAFRVNFE